MLRSLDAMSIALVRFQVHKHKPNWSCIPSRKHVASCNCLASCLEHQAAAAVDTKVVIVLVIGPETDLSTPQLMSQMMSLLVTKMDMLQLQGTKFSC